ncbi:hypothetical protein PMIN06_008022 [Paraphaeosphaeria minitans]
MTMRNRSWYILRAAAAALCHPPSLLSSGYSSPYSFFLRADFVGHTNCHVMAVHDPESFARRGEQLESITIAHITLSWLFIALRAYTRVFVKPNFGWDDLAMIFAGMIYTVYCAFIFYIEAHGGGTHVTSVAQLSDLTKRAVGSEATYIATVMMLKISVGILFARIVVQRWQLVVIYTTIVISCISASASFFYCLFRCGPDLDEPACGLRFLNGLRFRVAADSFALEYQHES